ncbi:MAG: NUDIX hydrolase [Desulfobacterales bacterium]|nr:NUDIX hydrolase [Desulfobacterales bacterium]
MASIERALELPQRTLTKWKNGRTKPSATVITLLKFLRIFPWLLEVAENKFDYSTAQKIHIENAVNKLLASLSFDKNEFINTSSPVSASAEFNISALLHSEEKVRRLPIIQAQFIVFAVVRCRNKFLLIREQKPKNGWYLPAGKVGPGEGFIEAVRRETLEEAGIPIEVDGVVRIECLPDNAGMRLIFSARPADDTPPKSEPDEHSLEAGWFTLEEMKTLQFRCSDAINIFSYITKGGFVAPLSTLAREGDPFY